MTCCSPVEEVDACAVTVFLVVAMIAKFQCKDTCFFTDYQDSLSRAYAQP
jgi:hypothetical protein